MYDWHAVRSFWIDSSLSETVCRTLFGMASSMSQIVRRWLIAFAILLMATKIVHAHDPDTSYARFSVSRDAIHTTLTYDLFTLMSIHPQLDADRDRRVTAAELASRSAQFAEFFRERIQFEIDGKPADFGELQPLMLSPEANGVIEERDYHETKALVPFVFRKSLTQAPSDFFVSFNFFSDLGDLHTVLGVIQQDGNEHQVLFRDDERDYLFDTGYEATSPSSDDPKFATESPALPRSERSNKHDSLTRQLLNFFKLGVEHIFLGYDHILFLMSLLVVARLRELIKIVTSFTVAHSITLILATLEVIELPSRVVESAIAISIVYVSVENFWILARQSRASSDSATSPTKSSTRWRVTFLFGLIHGFGFAGVLRELGLPTVGLVRSLVAFNVGVEAGQLAIVLMMFPVMVLLSRSARHAVVVRLASGAIALCGMGWLVDRVFGLGWMPF